MTVAALCVTTGSIWALNNQREFQAAAKTLRIAVNEFLSEHMVEPIQYVCGFVPIIVMSPRLIDMTIIIVIALLQSERL